MKKIIFLLIVLSFLIAGCKVMAEEPLQNPGTLPDSPFYFLKSWKESIQIFFTFGAENKAEQFMHLAEVRLAEYQKMIEKGKTEIAEKTLEKYEQQLNRALEKADEVKKNGKDGEKLKETFSEKIIKHQEVLNDVLNKVPEEAKKGIENAIEMSRRGFENAIQAVSGEKKEELKRRAEEVKNRIEEKIIESKPAEPGACIQVITPAVSPNDVCKEFPTPCDVPTGWKKVDKCPAVKPVPVSIPVPAPISAPTPASLVACCSAGGGCKLVDTKETCLGKSGKPMSVSSCSPNPCPQPTPVYNECKQGPMKDYECPGGTLVKWQCECTAHADGEETRLCSVKPSESCPTGAAPLTITGIDVRHLLWITKEWTVIEHIFWTTNIPATSYVEYGPTTSYGFTTSPSPESPKTQHVAEAMRVLEGTGQPFERNATYHFRIITEDAQGHKIISGDYTFTTGL